MKTGEWSIEELETLKNNRNNMTVEEIAKLLDRKTVSISSKISNLGLKKKAQVAVGMKINKITIVKRISVDLLNCKCHCGKKFNVDRGRFYGKHIIKSCGCHKKVTPMLLNIKTITPEDYSYRYLFSRYLRGAINKKRVFDLTFEQFKHILKRNCIYCGMEPRAFNAVEKQKKLSNEDKLKYVVYANGVDRLDSNEGYTLKNTVSCCKECNYAKRNMELSEWNSYLNRIFKHRYQQLEDINNKLA
jgi:hypothetical protein